MKKRLFNYEYTLVSGPVPIIFLYNFNRYIFYNIGTRKSQGLLFCIIYGILLHYTSRSRHVFFLKTNKSIDEKYYY